MRIEIERIVLGECLLENAYQKVADILTPANFSPANVEQGHTHDHQVIFKAFDKLYPNKPISFLTVNQLLPSGYAAYLAYLTQQVYSSVPIRTHAVMLLEFSLRESFIKTLQNLQQIADVRIRPALYEIQDESLDYDNDIFEVIEKATTYLEPFSNLTVNDTLTRFQQGINKRITLIKKQASIDVLLDNLQRLNNSAHDTNSKMAIAHLADVIKSILAQPQLSTTTLNHILTVTA